MTVKKIPLPLAVLPFLLAITGLLSAIFLVHAPLYLGLVLGWLTALVLARLHGHAWRDVLQGTYQGMKSTFFVIGILLMIAGVISAWLDSGTVPALIVYGIRLIRPEYLVATAFLLAAGTSMMLGSSVGTLSTMGAALAGMAQVYGIEPALIGGALLSGAMVGDRMSPVSGTFHLVANMTGTRAEDNYKPMSSTGVPMIAVCLLLYVLLGFGKATHAASPLQNPLLQHLIHHFQLPWPVMLPPALVLLLALFRVPIRRNLGLGMLFGAGLAIVVQGQSWIEVLKALWLGYDLQMDGVQVLHGGGVWPMCNEVLLILAAGALNGVLEQSGMMGTILQVLLDRIKTVRGLILSTVLLSISMALLACNQALSVIVPGRTLRKTYDEMGVPPRLLVRSLADSGVVSSALIPWNLHGILCSTAIGIATTVYFPYAFYLWGLPIFTLLLALGSNHKGNSKSSSELLQSSIDNP